jgi:hypothetical protein
MKTTTKVEVKNKNDFGISRETQKDKQLSNSNQPIEPYINKTTRIKKKKCIKIHKTIVIVTVKK